MRLPRKPRLACGATAVTFVDARDEPVLEPAPGEVRLWPARGCRACSRSRRIRGAARARSAACSASSLRRSARSAAGRSRLGARVAKDFHALRFGRRLWICPHHERVSGPDAVVVTLDPGLAFGTGTHPSTALCLEWLDAHFPGPPAPAEHSERKAAHGLDAHMPESPTGCARHRLWLRLWRARRSRPCRLGAGEVHAFDIDPQALIATRAQRRGQRLKFGSQVHIQQRRDAAGGRGRAAREYPRRRRCARSRPASPRWCGPGGQVVLGGPHGARGRGGDSGLRRVL